jgi:AcrR family transcriptional regulator
MSPRRKDVQRREELLAAIIEAYGHGGIGNRSLRDLAEAVGTSHRMLLHHFGSRDGLLVAVVEEVEARQRDRLAGMDPASPSFLAEAWAPLSEQEMRPVERLFFECYTRGANGEVPFDRLHPDAVNSWLSTAEGLGFDRAHARLGLAVVRGLLLDLVATGDDAGTADALALYATFVARDAEERTA